MDDANARIALIMHLLETTVIVAGRARAEADALRKEARKLRNRAARLRAETQALRAGPPPRRSS
jgi:hypothetical protein